MNLLSRVLLANVKSKLIVLLCLATTGETFGATQRTPLATEKVSGQQIWVSHTFPENTPGTRSITVKVWFDRQFLGDGDAYVRRSMEFASATRRALREQVVTTLKKTSAKSFAAANRTLKNLLKKGTISHLERHWIINGFTCKTTVAGLASLKTIPGVKNIFIAAGAARRPAAAARDTAGPKLPEFTESGFDPQRYQHPWYIFSLQADRVWKELHVTGKGTLNIIHDFNFVYPVSVARNVYQNPGEIPGNAKDDDRNGLIDDCYGFNFLSNTATLSVESNVNNTQSLHGTSCANIICGAGSKASPFEFGIAPQSRWAGIIAGSRIEPAIEWAIEHQADTYSMSFSRPNMGELRSHWRKIMEHGSFCGVHFVSGAGNFAQSEKIPIQMRAPEDIPNAVFAAAGVQRDLTRTVFSSKGPVQWNTEHYQDGIIQKPEVCAFNHRLPLLLPDGTVRPNWLSGNSFAGPMFCGAISLMLSADPDLLPWQTKKIITSTAQDIAASGVDYETGAGLINCYRAVREVLRLKAVREGADPTPFTGRTAGDTIDIPARLAELQQRQLVVEGLQATGTAFQAGIRSGDIILELDAVAIKNKLQWTKAITALGGQAFTLSVERNGTPMKIPVKKGTAGFGRLVEIYQAPVFK